MKLSITFKLSLSIVVFIFLGTGLVGGAFYFKSTKLLVEHALEAVSEKIENVGEMFRIIMNAQDADIKLFVDSPIIQKLLRTRANEKITGNDNVNYYYWVDQLEFMFEKELLRNSAYLSLQFIDVSGQELVHVGRKGRKIIHYSGSRLSNKKKYEYFYKTLALPAGVIYLSEVKLNRKNGKLVRPFQEILHSAMPVYDERTSEISGLIVITVYVGDALRNIQRRIEESIHGELFITNERGSYLLHNDASKTYGVDLGRRYRIQEDFPSIAQYYLPDSLVTKVTLMPEETDGVNVVNFVKIPFDRNNTDRFIAVIITQNISSVTAHVSELLEDVILISLILSLIGGSLAVVFSYKFTRPIMKITQAVNDYSKNVSINGLLPVNRNDEIGVLANSFKCMMEMVNDSQDKLKNSNDNLEAMIEERTNALMKSEAMQRTMLEAMADAIITIDNKSIMVSFNPAAEALFGYCAEEVIGENVSMLVPDALKTAHQQYTDKSRLTVPRVLTIDDKLEGKRKDGSLFPMELSIAPMQGVKREGFVGILRDITERIRIDKMKAEFISTVSHELRTPLTSIRGSLGLLVGGAVGELPSQALEMLTIANNNTNQLLLLINDILDIQKIESGQLTYKFESLLLLPFLEESLINNTAYAKQYEVVYLIDKKSKDLSVYADKDRLMQVMANLLSNAAKFSPKNDSVVISIEKLDTGFIRISVTDHGSGVPEEFRDKLFDKFTQSDSSDTRQKGGTGLGLAIAKAVVEEHGGKIGFFNGESNGATFYIDIPASREKPRQVA